MFFNFSSLMTTMLVVSVVWFTIGAYVSYKFCKNAGTSGNDE